MLAPVVALRPVAGDQLYVGELVDEALNPTAGPAEQVVPEVGETLNVGAEPTPTVNVPVLLQLLVPLTE